MYIAIYENKIIAEHVDVLRLQERIYDDYAEVWSHVIIMPKSDWADRKEK